jgi:hypothetical protein
MVPSQKRILRTWQDHKIGPNPREQRSSFHCHGIVQSEGQKSLYLAAPPYEFEPDDFVLVKDYCNNLCTAANDISNHFRLLDGEYSKLVDCRFLVHSEEYTDESAVRRANDILRRLPEFPPELSLGSERSLELESVGRGYFTVGPQRKGTDETVERVWESMQVSCQMSTNVVRMALLLAQGRPNVPSWKNLRRLGNTTAELLEEVNELANAAINPSQREAWFVVQAFLWSSWQRVTMLFFWYVHISLDLL